MNNVNPKWRDVLNIIQRYIMCEGRFATVSRYHLTFLLHLNDESKLNMPYYLVKSIEKMVTWVRNHHDHTNHSLFHHVLIKILITIELKKMDKSWKHFLFWSCFEVELQTNDEDKEGKKK